MDLSLSAAAWAPSGGVLSVELASAVPAIKGDRVHRSSDGTVTLFVKLHQQPLGRLVLTPPETGMTAGEVADALWQRLPEIREHLRADGHDIPDHLPVDGLGAAGDAPCLAGRRQALADPPSMTVVIATRDRTSSLMRCLSSAAGLDYPHFDVVVVDSAPTDNSTQLAIDRLRGRLGDVPLRYVREPRPGLAMAHRRGLAVATGRWVAITDDDVVIDDNWLAAIAEGASWDPSIACVTGLILPAELVSSAQALLERHGGFARGFVPRLYDQARHRPDDPLFPLTAGRMGSGANMAFRRDALVAAGGFDSWLGAGTPARGGDDLAAFLRVLRAGHTLAYQPGAIVWHHHRREYAGLRRQLRHYGVGLGAYLTDAIMREPRLGLRLLRHSLLAGRHMLSGESPKNASKGDDFPRELERAERLGILLGPLAYARSRFRYRGA